MLEGGLTVTIRSTVVKYKYWGLVSGYKDIKILISKEVVLKTIYRVWCAGGKSMWFRLEILQNFGKKLMIIKITGRFLSFKWLKREIHTQNKKLNNFCLSPPVSGHSISNWDTHTHTHKILKNKKFSSFLDFCMATSYLWGAAYFHKGILLKGL